MPTFWRSSRCLSVTQILDYTFWWFIDVLPQIALFFCDGGNYQLERVRRIANLSSILLQLMLRFSAWSTASFLCESFAARWHYRPTQLAPQTLLLFRWLFGAGRCRTRRITETSPLRAWMLLLLPPGFLFWIVQGRRGSWSWGQCSFAGMKQSTLAVPWEWSICCIITVQCCRAILSLSIAHSCIWPRAIRPAVRHFLLRLRVDLPVGAPWPWRGWASNRAVCTF